MENREKKYKVFFENIYKNVKKYSLVISALWLLVFIILFYGAFAYLDETTFPLIIHIVIVVLGILGFLFIFLAFAKIFTGYKEVKTIVEELSALKNKFFAFFNNSPFAIVIFTEDGHIEFANTLFGKLTDNTLEEIHDLNMSALFPDYDEMRRINSNFFSGQGKETVLLQKNGEKLNVRVKVQKLETEEHAYYQAVVIDITKEYETKRKLYELGRINEVAGRISKFGGCKYSVKENKITFSLSVSSLFNLSQKEFYTFEDYINLIKEDSRQSFRIRMNNLRQPGDTFVADFELQNPAQNSNVTYVRQVCELEITEDGEKIIWGSVFDISELKRKQNLLEEEKSKYSTILNSSPVGLALLDIGESLDYIYQMIPSEAPNVESIVKNISEQEIAQILASVKIVEANKKLLDFFGEKPILISMKDLVELLPEGELSKIKEILLPLIFKNEIVETTLKVRKVTTNEYRDVFISLQRYDNNDEHYLVLSTADVTSIVAMQKKIKATNELLYSFLDAIPYLVVSLDTEGKIKFINETGENLLGYPRGELINMDWFDNFIDNETRKQLKKKFFETLNSPSPHFPNVTNKVITKNGVKQIYWYNKVIFDEKDKPEGMLSLGIDITEEKRKKKDLNKSHKELIIIKNQLERQNLKLKQAQQNLREREILLQNELKEKDKLFSIIAHDIRSPFTALLSGLQLLDMEFQSLDDNEKKELLQNAYSASKRIFQFIEQLLNWSRIRLDKVPLEFTAVNIEEEVVNVFQLFSENAKKKEIRLIKDVNPKLCINVDRNLFNGVLRNLISNALKFTPRGGEITIHAHEFTDRFHEIKIVDTGIGIPEDKLGELFKLSSSYTRDGTENESGTGFGLKLVYEFVKKLNGKIYVDSKEGEGTTFIVHLPKIKC